MFDEVTRKSIVAPFLTQSLQILIGN